MATTYRPRDGSAATEHEFRLTDLEAASGHPGTLQCHDDHVVVASGTAKVFGEYDDDGTLPAQYAVDTEDRVHRVLEYSSEDIWFSGPTGQPCWTPPRFFISLPEHGRTAGLLSGDGRDWGDTG